MNQHSVLKCIVAFLVFALLTAVSPDRASAAKPNVIVVMADDLGIGDVSPTNPDCKIKTPHLQKMADEGLIFLDAHTPSSVCSPTRYGLLTGRYNWRSRLARGVLSGTSSHLIPEDRPTLGHLMRKAGYHTAMIGKWHLGWDWHKTGNNIDFTKPVKNGPDINGFDQYYGHCGSLDMPPYVWVDTGRITAQPDRVEGVTKGQDRYGWYRKGPIGSDFKIPQVLPHLFDKSIEYVKSRADSAKAGKPFFLYLALPAPHTPIVPVPPFKDASGLNPYADFVMQTDHHMGQLLGEVKDAGLDDKTLVIFTSDNGCSPEANFPLLQGKGHYPSGKYRGHKADIYEGGHRVPFIVRWPGEIEGGHKTEALACLTDVYATLEAVTGQDKQTLGGEDGYNLLPVFKGEVTSERDTLISHSIGGSFAIREGSWKLCLSGGSGGWSAPREGDAKKKGLPPMQLYNLADDPAEKKNLVKDEPEKVKALLLLLDEQVLRGRCTPGEMLKNDRDVKFLPSGVKMPGEQDSSSSTSEHFFERLDANEDGKVTSAEAPAEGKMLVEFLLSRSGKKTGDHLSRQDFMRLVFLLDVRPTHRHADEKAGEAALASGEVQRAPENCPACAMGLTPEFVFKRLDVNEDKFVTVTEFRRSPGMDDEAKAREVVGRLDKSGDGKLSWEELKTAYEARHANCEKPDPATVARNAGQLRPDGRGVGNRFARVFILRSDRNDDGKIDESEFRGGAAGFLRLDKNKNGFIEVDELDELHQRRLNDPKSMKQRLEEGDVRRPPQDK